MINIKEVDKIARMIKYPKPNLPVPAVLVVCCLIDTLAKNYSGNRCGRFAKYIEKKMRETFQQLKNNDSLKSSQISKINCNFKGHDKKKKCKTSTEILYRHIRCGLVHNYFKLEGYAIINRPNKKQGSVIIDRSIKNNKYALVLNGPAFVKDFLASL